MILRVLHRKARTGSLDKRLAETGFVGPGFGQIRLVAATAVLLHHCGGADYKLTDPLFSYSRGFLHVGLLAVLVFFSISGFLVAPGLMRSRNVIDYATNRALRILPGLTTVVVVSMVVLGPMLTVLPAGIYYSDPRFYLYAKNILTLTTDYLPGVQFSGGQPAIVNGVLWTLHFEVLCYIALAVMSLLGILGKSRVILAVFIAVYALYVADVSNPVVAELLPGRLVTFVSLFVYFAAGVALYAHRDMVPYSASVAAAALALFMLALPVGAGAIAAPLCLPYVVIYAGLSNLPGGVLVKRDLSYGVYLIHAPILASFTILYPGVRPWWVVAAVVALVTLTLAYLSWTFVEEPILVRKKAVAKWIDARLHRIQITTGRWTGARARP